MGGLTLRAHYLNPHDANGLKLQRAHPQRAWMQETLGAGGTTGYANRCLPLLIANQLGWDVVSTRAYLFVPLAAGVIQIQAMDGQRLPTAGYPMNNFGGSLVTWASPWVFETPPGWDLLVLPSPNHLTPAGVTVLAALVETDHGITRFTFNWRLKFGTAVFVDVGDIIATVVPYPTDQLADWALEEDDERPEGMDAWFEQRREDSQAMAEDPKVWHKRYWNAAKRRKL